MKYEFHEIANIFPLLEGDQFQAFVADIKENGQREPARIYQGKILDGRNRYRACVELGIKCKAENVEPDDPIAYVLSLNRFRRHLSHSQWAMIGDRARDLYDQQAKERQKLSKGRGKKGVNDSTHLLEGKSRDHAGAAVGISGPSIDAARTVRQQGIPELVSAVEQDRVNVRTAAKIAKQPPEIQQEILKSEATTPTKLNEFLSDSDDEQEEIKSQGKGIRYANEAIDCLKRIPKNDALRKRGFQIVTDWIRHNK